VSAHREALINSGFELGSLPDVLTLEV